MVEVDSRFHHSLSLQEMFHEISMNYAAGNQVQISIALARGGTSPGSGSKSWALKLGSHIMRQKPGVA